MGEVSTEFERQAGFVWTRMTFLESTWDVICRNGTQSVMKVWLNPPIMHEVLEKLLKMDREQVEKPEIRRSM